MPAKQILFADNARLKILRGITLLARAVKVTLGPRGRNVVIDHAPGAPTVTKDGVTVAREIELPDPFENMGAQLVREAASRTSDAAGDGTTTATVLAEAIYREGLRNVTAGANPLYLKRGIDRAVAAAVAELARLAQPVGDRAEVRQVASLSANADDTIGDIIADAMDRVGKDGVIMIEEGRSLTTILEVVEGMQFDQGYLSPYFATDPERMEAVLEEPYVLVHEKALSNLHELLPLLQAVAKSRKPLLVVAESVAGDALATLVINKMRGIIPVCAVRAPGYGDRRKAVLQDIAVLTGGRCITDDLGLVLANLTLADLGRAKRVTVAAESTTILVHGGPSVAVRQRLKQLRREIDETDSDHDRGQLQERLANLAGGIAVIRVGAATEVEMKEKKARVEDALHATRAAVAEGIVAGGGVALLRCAAAVNALNLGGDEAIGAQIVRRAIESPIRMLCANAGVEGAVVAARVAAGRGSQGYNVATGEYEDLVKAGVVDPAKVTRLALQNAASIAGLLLTIDCMITDQPEAGAGPGSRRSERGGY